MLIPWTNVVTLFNSLMAYVGVVVVLFGLTGCASSLKDVTNGNAPTMKDIYENHTQGGEETLELREAELLRRRLTPEVVQLGWPPYPEQLDHLYPRLPNPDLFMYVRPHAVGHSGAPIPAYITRFSLYERQPYAMPGETLDAVRNISGYRTEIIAQRKAEEERAKANVNQRELFHD